MTGILAGLAASELTGRLARPSGWRRRRRCTGGRRDHADRV